MVIIGQVFVDLAELVQDAEPVAKYTNVLESQPMLVQFLVHAVKISNQTLGLLLVLVHFLSRSRALGSQLNLTTLEACDLAMQAIDLQLVRLNGEQVLFLFGLVEFCQLLHIVMELLLEHGDLVEQEIFPVRFNFHVLLNKPAFGFLLEIFVILHFLHQIFLGLLTLVQVLGHGFQLGLQRGHLLLQALHCLLVHSCA